MTKKDKLIRKIREGHQVSYEEAETLLKFLGFEVDSEGSHHVFRKVSYPGNMSLKKRSQLKSYQIKLLQEAIESYEKE